MKLRLLVQTLSAITIALSATTTITQSSYAQSNKFICGMSGGVPATVVRTSRGNKPIIRWVDTTFPPPWTPQQRCEAISARFQRFYKDGRLKFLTHDKINGQNVLCVASYRGGSCLRNGVVVTLKSGIDPKRTLARLKDIQGESSGKPIQLSGNSNNDKNEVISYVNDKAYLNLEKLIAEAEGSEIRESCPAGIPTWEC